MPAEDPAAELVADIARGSDVADFERLSEVLPGGEALGGVDPLRMLAALGDMASPGALTSETVKMVGELAKILVGSSDVEIPPRDKRFADTAWSENPLYRRWAQAYLALSDSMERLASTPELKADWRRESRARFASALVTSALSPTNLLLGNPAAIKRAFETGGKSLLKGARNLAHDVRTNGGMPSQVDPTSFKVGENLAATPGSVIYREEMFEILHYRPTTPTVRARPLLMVPPQVNKYYFLDLAPGRSLVEYLIAQGLHYFTLVWRNPRKEHGHWGLEDYVAAEMRAVDVVSEVSGSDDVNLLAACAGGLTSALMLGHLAGNGEADRVNSIAFAITMIDSRHPNVLGMMTTDRIEKTVAKDAAKAKVYDRKEVARTFAWMRPNDLVFNYVVNNWLLGNDPPAFDILAWNNDGTNLAARFDAEMLDIYAHNRAAEPGGVRLWGRPVDLTEITCDNYVVAGMTDHITPWMPCYMTSRLLSGPSEVVITSTGHIQTIVNPPGKPRARYFAAPGNGEPQQWLEGATAHEGSWWPHLAEWLIARSGDEQKPPRRLGNRKFPPGEPAPGLYVHEQ